MERRRQDAALLERLEARKSKRKQELLQRQQKKREEAEAAAEAKALKVMEGRGDDSVDVEVGWKHQLLEQVNEVDDEETKEDADHVVEGALLREKQAAEAAALAAKQTEVTTRMGHFTRIIVCLCTSLYFSLAGARTY